MSELIKAIEAHLRQLAPHQKERDTATLLRNAVSELSASQAREAELREKLKVVTNLHAIEQDMRIAEEKLRRAAEARIKASQEQEPVAYTTRLALDCCKGAVAFEVSGYNLWDENGIPLYEQPPIPPELAELQRDLSGAIKAQNELHEQYYQLQRENAELRKLLEESNVDSLRYRFLRRAWAEPAVLSALNEANPEPASDAEFDASVDAAMLAVQPKEPKQ